MLNATDLTDKVAKANGTRKTRILRQADVEQFINLVNEATPEQHTIRVYSSDGFVPNSYKYRASISYLQATRNAETGEFYIGAGTTDAKRSNGLGSLVTINGRVA